MHRFYCPDATPVLATLARAVVGEAVPAHTSLQGDELRHARKVLRLGVGDSVAIFDGNGHCGEGRILEMSPHVATIALHNAQWSPPRLPRLTIASAMPKGPRAQDMVHQLCQLGCDVLIPLRTARSIVDPRDTKLERLTRLVVESAKQSGQSYLMKIEAVHTLTQVLAMDNGAAKFIAALAFPSAPAEIASVKSVEIVSDADDSVTPPVHESLATAKDVCVLIGPEGGWTAEEHRAAQSAGFQPWALAPAVLRIETAAAAAAAIVRYLTLHRDRPQT